MDTKSKVESRGESSAKRAPTLSRSHLPISIMPPKYGRTDGPEKRDRRATAKLDREINAMMMTVAAIEVLNETKMRENFSKIRLTFLSSKSVRL